MKRSLCVLLILCLTAGLMSGALGEKVPEGRPFVNPELPGNLPGECPAPEEDYYLHVNYERYLRASPEEDPSRRADRDLSEAIWALTETGESAESRILGIMTKLIMDGERREREGMGPLLARVRRVRETKDLSELSELCREEGFMLGSPFASFDLRQSVLEPDRFVVEIMTECPVPLMDMSEDDPDPGMGPRPDSAAVEEELKSLGYDDAEAVRLTERLVQYQEEFQAGVWEEGDTDGEMRWILTPAQIKAGCVPLYDQMVSQGLFPEGKEDEGIYETGTIYELRALQALYREEDLDVFKAVICLAMLRYARDYLDPAAYARAHEIDGEPDLKEAAWAFMTEPALEVTERAFALDHITPEQRSLVLSLSEEIRQALADRLMRTGWMSAESAKRAADKALKIKTVMPGEQGDFSPLLEQLSAGDMSLLDAAALLDRARQQNRARLAGMPYDRGLRSLFLGSLLVVNAQYVPVRNTFNMMAGMLMPDFYDDSSRETILATVGQTIAHEMSHGFDTFGSQYDAEGAFVSVLTQEDQAVFAQRAQRIVEDLDRVELAEGVRLNGELVINEVAADLLGLRLVLDLAQRAEGFDYDLFFRTLGRKFYRYSMSREALMSDYEHNPHPAPYLRGDWFFPLMDEFYTAYPQVKEGCGMYVPPEERLSLW